MEMNTGQQSFATSKDFYRSTTMAFKQEGSDDIHGGYFLTDGIYSSESTTVNNAFYGDNCDYVYSDWN